MADSQVTKKQHFVPQFYLKGFAENGVIQGLDLRAKRIAKPRPYQSVGYEKFFYAQQTGVEDEVSQHAEALLSGLESQIAEQFLTIIEHAQSKQLTNGDLDTLAYMMALQWMRTKRFRKVVQNLTTQMMKWVVEAQVQSSGFIDDYIATANELGEDMSRDEAERLQAYVLKGNFSIEPDNSMHLRFMASKEHMIGVHNLFFNKQWNVLKANETFRFVTSDNPVAEWLPSAGIFGNSFLERKHYFALSPDIMIESVYPNRDDKTQSPASTVAYRDCTDDDVLVCDMVVAHHTSDFVYSKSKDELQQLLWQSNKGGTAMERFKAEYLQHQTVGAVVASPRGSRVPLTKGERTATEVAD